MLIYTINICTHKQRKLPGVSTVQRSDLDSLVLCAFSFKTPCKQDNDVAHNVKSVGLGKWGKCTILSAL